MLGSQLGLSEDRAQGPERQIAITVDRHNDEMTFSAATEIVMAATNVRDAKPCAFQGADEPSSPDARQARQGATTSSSTTSVSASGGGRGIPSLAAASR